MTKHLHITNGDSAATIIESCGLGGDVLPWRDPMHHGPFPSGLSFEQLSLERVKYLSGDTSITAGDHHALSERDRVLFNSAEYDAVTLWFEHDLLDQLQILQLLNWFAGLEHIDVELTMICINQFAGINNFRGLGQLTSAQMLSLFSQRTKVTQVQLESAQAYWLAFCLDEPLSLLALLKATRESSELPFMSAALQRHCQEFPWISDGLTRTERQIINLVNNAVEKPVRVFMENMDLETCLYIGDSTTFRTIADLCDPACALLACKSGHPFDYSPSTIIASNEFREQRLRVTELGKRVITEEQSVLDIKPRDCWLGGIHLNSSKPMWCWDASAASFSKTD